MKVLKHQGTKDVVDVIKQTNHRKIDRDTAEFLNSVANLNLVYEEPEEGEGIDMCKGMEDYTRETKLEGEVMGGIWALKKMGVSAQRIVEMIMEDYRVSREYVEKLMQPAAT